MSDRRRCVQASNTGTVIRGHVKLTVGLQLALSQWRAHTPKGAGGRKLNPDPDV